MHICIGVIRLKRLTQYCYTAQNATNEWVRCSLTNTKNANDSLTSKTKLKIISFKLELNDTPKRKWWKIYTQERMNESESNLVQLSAVQRPSHEALPPHSVSSSSSSSSSSSVLISTIQASLKMYKNCWSRSSSPDPWHFANQHFTDWKKWWTF